VEITLLIVYGLLLAFIFGYSLVQLSLVLAYRRSHRKAVAPDRVSHATWPPVTVQLPVYNERYVVERLIDAVAQLDYPADRLEIQVLDDGNDASVELAAARIAHWQAKGVNIQHLRRPERTGYKAGALAYGTERATGAFIAVFDADFVPPADFLKQTLPLFANDRIGMVQTRWGHLNEDYSLLTRLQAFGLNAHFTVEQVGRNALNHFINFNGTGGVWRKTCIVDAGGWQPDTLTEDLDLSYRAQMNGWKFVYTEALESPAELPAEMNAVKSQQFRWTKGAAECAVKHLPRLVKRSDLPFATRLHAFFHLMNSSVFVAILMAALLSVPVLWVRVHDSRFDLLFNLASLFLLSLVILVVFYRTASKQFGRGFGSFVRDFPLFLSVYMGLSLHNALAVIEGWSGRKSAFVRTPKFAIDGKGGGFADKSYRAVRVDRLTLLELVLGLYFLAAVAYGALNLEFGLMPFHLMLAVGFLYVGIQSYRHAALKR
jgi:cellulose synthase/poly-beta-1,6-N-acetylglucosamine synthase-like glycosyltransferase